MELLITRFYNELDDPMHYSASRMELGEDAGKITWNNAAEDATEHSYWTQQIRWRRLKTTSNASVHGIKKKLTRGLEERC